MGKVKNWLMSEQKCVVCGKLSIPHPVYSTIGNPVCSVKCFDEFTDVMEAMIVESGELIDIKELDEGK